MSVREIWTQCHFKDSAKLVLIIHTMKDKDYLWLLIPGGILLLIILSIMYVPAEPPDPSGDNRVQYCGPGGTEC